MITFTKLQIEKMVETWKRYKWACPECFVHSGFGRGQTMWCEACRCSMWTSQQLDRVNEKGLLYILCNTGFMKCK